MTIVRINARTGVIGSSSLLFTDTALCLEMRPALLYRQPFGALHMAAGVAAHPAGTRLAVVSELAVLFEAERRIRPGCALDGLVLVGAAL
jgi:hypothetical protein